MEKVKYSNKGFTLVELMVVVTIIAILTTIAVPNLMGAVTRARVVKAFTDMRIIGNAAQVYWIDKNTYPTSSSDFTKGAVIYMTTIPKDPFNDNNSRAVAAGALEENSFGYYTTGDETWLIVSNAPDKIPDTISETIDWSARTVGQLGGWEGAEFGYGYQWYDPGAGSNSIGDLGVSGP